MEFRDPIHGFIQFNELEAEIINSAPFQRLRRIKQLALTDYIYTGASHSRFEHSLGVMHLAGRIFQTLVSHTKSAEILASVYKIDHKSFPRFLQIVRLAALLHDVGHTPFSHSGEDLLPPDKDGKTVKHEAYSTSIIRLVLNDIIDNHPQAISQGITAEMVAGLIEGKGVHPQILIWKDIISGQIDADRMDYLLRDSYHCGVKYGTYDLERLVTESCLCEMADEEDKDAFQIGIVEDAMYAAESLLIARHMMFSQVYFHKTRTIFDYHLAECIRTILGSSKHYPSNETRTSLEKFLTWDDWTIQNAIKTGGGGEHGKIIFERRHHRLIRDVTLKSPTEVDVTVVKIEEALKEFPFVKLPVSVKGFGDDIPVRMRSVSGGGCKPLSQISSVPAYLRGFNHLRFYAPLNCRDSAFSACKLIPNS